MFTNMRQNRPLTMQRPAARQKQRKTLRQALRDLLHRRKNISSPDHPEERTFGSGILKKAPSIPRLPNFSTVSVFPSFGDVSNDRPEPSRITNHIAASPGRPTCTSQSSRLLPQPSLSSFGIFPQRCEGSAHRETVLKSVPEPYQRGTSRQASIVHADDFTDVGHSVSRSRSSLRIRESKSTLPRESQPRTESGSRSYKITHSLRRLDSAVSIQSSSENVGSPLSGPSNSTRTPSKSNRSPVEMVEHFKCFCILDTGQAGCPVTGTSKDLRYVFDIGEKFVLNNHECEGSSMDVVSGVDASGEEVVHLVLFSPLISPSTGRSRFMLVSLIDVTEFIRESANQVPELDTISEEGSVTEIATPPPPLPSHALTWSRSAHHLSADDLLGGCSIVEGADQHMLSMRPTSDDIWLALAESEGGFKSNKLRRNVPSDSSRASERTKSAPSSHASDTTDDILEDFISSLQRLYSDFFFLGQSPLADDTYEMCNVSPSVYATGKEWIDGHLSKTSVDVIAELSERLAQTEPFSLKVRWGTKGVAKQMYCSPLYAASRSITWVCYLVDEQMSALW